MKTRRRGYDHEYSIDLTKNFYDSSDLSRPITPAELENCMNNMKSNFKNAKGQKSRKGSVVNHRPPKETRMSKWDKGNNEIIVEENKTFQTNGKAEAKIFLPNGI